MYDPRATRSRPPTPVSSANSLWAAAAGVSPGSTPPPTRPHLSGSTGACSSRSCSNSHPRASSRPTSATRSMATRYRRRVALEPSVEGDLAVWMSGRVVGGVVGSGVVAGAEESAVDQVGGSAVCPSLPVVCVAEPGWPVAAVGDAALVPEAHREQLGPGEEPAGAADVEDLGDSVEDDGDDPAGAREAPGEPGADAFAGVEDPGLVESPGEGVEVDLDDDGGVGAADLREALGGDAFDELGERTAQPLRPRPPLHTRTLGRSDVFGCGDREQHLLQHRRLQGRQREPAVDLPVPVV